MQILEISDESIMLRAQQGELNAIGLLYQRYSKKLYNFFLRLTANRDSSADLTQNVFYRVLKYKGSYNPEHLFKTWLYKMARNCLTDYRLDSNKHPIISNWENVLSTQMNDDTASSQSAQDAQLFKALEGLPFESKELLVMSKFQSLKYEEISSITGDSVPNIKVKVHRALIKLKELYFELDKA